MLSAICLFLAGITVAEVTAENVNNIEDRIKELVFDSLKNSSDMTSE